MSFPCKIDLQKKVQNLRFVNCHQCLLPLANRHGQFKKNVINHFERQIVFITIIVDWHILLLVILVM